jgi:hypothetical protein
MVFYYISIKIGIANIEEKGIILYNPGVKLRKGETVWKSQKCIS